MQSNGAVLDGVSNPSTPFASLRIAEAITHLQAASVSLERLSADARAGPSPPAWYRLCEASHAIHRALLALAECLEG